MVSPVVLMVLNVMGGGDGDLGGDAVGTDDVVLMLVKILVEATSKLSLNLLFTKGRMIAEEVVRIEEIFRQ